MKYKRKKYNSFQAEEKKSEEPQPEIVTRLTDDDHLKEVSVKREEKPAPVTHEVDQEAETSQQEVKIEATSQQEAADDAGKESINRTDDEKEVADESLVAGEGYVLCNKAGDIEVEEQRKVCET